MHRKSGTPEGQDTDVSFFSLGRCICLQCRGLIPASCIPSSYPDALLQVIEDGGSQTEGFTSNHWVRERQINKERLEGSHSNGGWEAETLGLGGAKSHGLPRGDGVRNRDVDRLLPRVAVRTQEFSYKFACRSDYFVALVHRGGGKAIGLEA